MIGLQFHGIEDDGVLWRYKGMDGGTMFEGDEPYSTRLFVPGLSLTRDARIQISKAAVEWRKKQRIDRTLIDYIYANDQAMGFCGHDMPEAALRDIIACVRKWDNK